MKTFYFTPDFSNQHEESDFFEEFRFADISFWTDNSTNVFFNTEEDMERAFNIAEKIKS